MTDEQEQKENQAARMQKLRRAVKRLRKSQGETNDAPQAKRASLLSWIRARLGINTNKPPSE